MEYWNKKVLVVKAAVLIFLMGFSATVEAAGRLISQSPSYNISQCLDNGGDDDKYNYPERYQRFRRFPEEDCSTKKKKKDCCESCDCTTSYFGFRCQYKDVWESCPSSCPAGYYSCDKSHPPQCQCLASTPGNCTIPGCSR